MRASGTRLLVAGAAAAAAAAAARSEPPAEAGAAAAVAAATARSEPPAVAGAAAAVAARFAPPAGSGAAAGAAAPVGAPPSLIQYRIEVSLDPATRELRGRERVRWVNPSDAPVAAVPVHLYLNAFSHTGTTWMRGAGPGRFDVHDLLARWPEPWGWIEMTAIAQRTAAGERAVRARPIQPDDGNPLDRTLAEIALAEPVAPGAALDLSIAFTARLPVPIARTGGAGDFFLIAQWFPKIGVLETKGVRHAAGPRWAARQFHAPTEFYAEFADYDVILDAPEGFTVGATGERVEESARGGRRRYRYRQRAVHDFALVAARGLDERTATHRPRGGGPAVRARYLVPRGTAHQVPRWQRAVEAALDVLGERLGPYPYATLTVVCPPYRARRTGGMEYPTLITGVPGDPMWDGFPFGRVRLPEMVLVHEFGHQYFYGLLASNEQEEAFLDEGFNSYWEDRVMERLFPRGSEWGEIAGRAISGREAEALRIAGDAPRIREPIRKRPASLFYPGGGGSQIYTRPAITLATAEALFGRERIDRVFADYYRRFAFRHPDTEDFLQVAEGTGGADLGAFLREALSRERLPDFAVDEIESEPWQPPLGRIPAGDGAVTVTEKDRDAHGDLGLDPAAREPDGRVLVEITDPGFARGGAEAPGRVERRAVAPRRGAAEPGFSRDGRWFESRVRVTGPAWDHLPVEVELRFSDGVAVRDAWDGRAAWRGYRFVRGAPLREARIDPGGRIALDPIPDNDARSLAPHARFRWDWAAWWSALCAWVAAGVSLWL